MNVTEAMAKAEHDSETLVESVCGAQLIADKRDPFVELVLNDIRTDAMKLKNRIVWAAGAARRAKL